MGWEREWWWLGEEAVEVVLADGYGTEIKSFTQARMVWLEKPRN